MEPKQVADEIGDFILRKVLEMKKTGGVVGLSGGVDSTCVAALAKRAFDRHNAKHPNHPLEVVGYILPSNTNHPKDAEDGLKVATRLGIRHEVQSIEAIVEAFKTTNPEALGHKYHRGNLTSEIRAVVLHTKAATENKAVIGTGNKDEDYGVAYYTLFGDGAVHMSPIGNLPKRLVREMAAYLGFDDLSGRVSTAGPGAGANLLQRPGLRLRVCRAGPERPGPGPEGGGTCRSQPGGDLRPAADGQIRPMVRHAQVRRPSRRWSAKSSGGMRSPCSRRRSSTRTSRPSR